MFQASMLIRIGIGACVLAFLGVLVYVTTPLGCEPVPQVTPTMGSQGFRTWSGPTLVTFEHRGKKICIGKGFEAVGGKASGTGWAFFEDGLTGVLIQKTAFEEKTLDFVYSGYEVRLIYPDDTSASDRELYEATVRNAFERIGKLFGDSKNNKRRLHTVLVTAGVPRTDGITTPIYPDPRANLSIYVQSPHSPRGEELLIHAIAHLYNRQREDLSAYQRNQSPFPAEDFQELEASWSELAYRISNQGRNARVEYLENVHTAVTTKNFSLIYAPPFDKGKSEFDAIRPSAIVSRDASFLTAQYGHYILGPLAMIATEGMLRQRNAGATVEKILADIHAHKRNFFEALSEYLSKEEINTLQSWLFEGVPIPHTLIEKGLEAYTVQ